MKQNLETPPSPQELHRIPSPQRQTIALLLIVALIFVALIGGFLTGSWEPFQLLCPFGLGALTGQLPQQFPPPPIQEIR